MQIGRLELLAEVDHYSWALPLSVGVGNGLFFWSLDVRFFCLHFMLEWSTLSAHDHAVRSYKNEPPCMSSDEFDQKVFDDCDHKIRDFYEQQRKTKPAATGSNDLDRPPRRA